MKYKLVNTELNNKRNELSPIELVLKNRGITNPFEYTHLTDKAIHHYSLLNNIEEAKNCLMDHINNGDRIGILTDPDVDGYCASSIIYQYLSENYDKNKIEYYIHSGKQHGLSDLQIPNTIQLLIVPDSATNDTEKCKELLDQGIQTIVLDHHQKESENPFAIIVNPQIGNSYPNPALSGCAVVKKFLEILDDEFWCDSSKYDDLVALSIIADSMSIKDPENKRLVDKGLSKIQNKLFLALLNKQSYSTGGIVNINNVAFYISPLLNALIRSGTYEEKDLMFRAFIETDETFPYKKRGETQEVQEDIYTRIARLSTNLKAKQGREVDKSLDMLREKIKKYNWDQDKIMFCNADGIDWNYTGLVTIKVANEYNRPCLLLRINKDGLYSGSARNFSNVIGDLKGYLNDTGLFESLQGHSAAFGASIKPDNLKIAIQKINEDLKNVDMSFIYEVDFEIDADELTFDFVREMNELKNHYGQGIPESLVFVKNIRVNTNDIKIMGENKDTWKFTNSGECDIIKFKVPADDKLLEITRNSWGEDLVINVIGKLGLSNFQNILSGQCVVLDYEVVE
jgi:single-stranded-DNA-specific exonuclease